MATQNHWPPGRAAAMVAHFRQAHLDEDEVAEMATKAQVKSVVLHHYTPPDPAAYVKSVKAHFSGPVFAPADLDHYCLGTNEKTRDKANALGPCGNAGFADQE